MQPTIRSLGSELTTGFRLATNLLDIQWIPVRHTSGKISRISPYQIAERSDDEPVALAFPRPDFNGSILQLLIGLFQTCCPPETEGDWARKVTSRFTRDALTAAFAPFREAFVLDRVDGPCFMQDFDPALEGAEMPINRLLIDQPGEQGEKQNKDHFVHRSASFNLCPVCATVALFSLQLNAPSGGQGHRTSLRGGGPLTTLIVEDTLFGTIWSNVVPRSHFVLGKWQQIPACTDHVFPWLGETRVSSDDQIVTLDDVSPLAVFWAAPRRIRLNYVENLDGSCCSLCASSATTLAASYVMKAYGANYQSPPWRHPLSPHFLDKEGLSRPVHFYDSGAGYREWAGFVASEGQNCLSLNVAVAKARDLFGENSQCRFSIFGYQMDNMKAVQWHQAEMPFLRISPEHATTYDEIIRSLVIATDESAKMLYSCVKSAQFSERTEVRGDLNYPKVQLWEKTESPFFEMLRVCRAQLESKTFDRTTALESWLETLRRTAFDIFSLMIFSGDLSSMDMKRAFVAESRLRMALGPKARKLREKLGLPLPEPKKKKKDRLV